MYGSANNTPRKRKCSEYRDPDYALENTKKKLATALSRYKNATVSNLTTNTTPIQKLPCITAQTAVVDRNEERLERAREIIKLEFQREIDEHKQKLNEIDQSIESTIKIFNKLRYNLVSDYYTKQDIHINMVEAADLRGEHTLFVKEFQGAQLQQHPSLKKIISNKPTTLADIFRINPKRAAAKQALTKIDEVAQLGSRSQQKREQRRLQKLIREQGIVIDHSKGAESQSVKVFEQELSKQLSERVKEEQEEKPSTSQKALNAARLNNKIKHLIVIGNTSKYIGDESQAAHSTSNLAGQRVTHKWLLYVHAKDATHTRFEHLIKKIRFYLHASYKPHDIVDIKGPPYQLARRGWGEFPVRLQVFFHDDLQQKPMQLLHNLVLDKLQSGIQTMGAETLVEIWLRPLMCNTTEPVKMQPIVEHNKTEDDDDDDDDDEASSNGSIYDVAQNDNDIANIFENISNNTDAMFNSSASVGKTRTFSLGQLKYEDLNNDDLFEFLNRLDDTPNMLCVDDIDKLEPTVVVNEANLSSPSKLINVKFSPNITAIKTCAIEQLSTTPTKAAAVRNIYNEIVNPTTTTTPAHILPDTLFNEMPTTNHTHKSPVQCSTITTTTTTTTTTMAVKTINDIPIKSSITTTIPNNIQLMKQIQPVRTTTTTTTTSTTPCIMSSTLYVSSASLPSPLQSVGVKANEMRILIPKSLLVTTTTTSTSTYALSLKPTPTTTGKTTPVVNTFKCYAQASKPVVICLKPPALTTVNSPTTTVINVNQQQQKQPSKQRTIVLPRNSKLVPILNKSIVNINNNHLKVSTNPTLAGTTTKPVTAIAGTQLEKKHVQFVGAEGKIKYLQMFVSTTTINKYNNNNLVQLNNTKNILVNGKAVEPKTKNLITTATPQISSPIATSTVPVLKTYAPNVFQKEGKLYLRDPQQNKLKQQQKQQISLLKPQVSLLKQQHKFQVPTDHDYAPAINVNMKPATTTTTPTTHAKPTIHWGLRETREKKHDNNDTLIYESFERRKVEIAFERAKFENMASAIEFLLRRLPLIAPASMKHLQAFCFVRCTNLAEFKHLPAMKQRVLEWLRAKYINKSVRAHKQLQMLLSAVVDSDKLYWSTKEIVLFARYYVYTPPIKCVNACAENEKEDNFRVLLRHEVESEQRLQSHNTLTNVAPIIDWLAANQTASCEVEPDVQLDVVNIDSQVDKKTMKRSEMGDAGKDCLYLAVPAHLEYASEVVQDVCKDLGLHLTPAEQICENVRQPLAETVLAQCLRMFVEQLVRRSIGLSYMEQENPQVVAEPEVRVQDVAKVLAQPNFAQDYDFYNDNYLGVAKCKNDCEHECG